MYICRQIERGSVYVERGSVYREIKREKEREED